MLTENIYVIHILTLANIYAILAMSWDLVSGYTGQVSLGHALFFGGGGYVSAFLAMWYGVPPPICPLISGTLMGVISLVVGVPCLRLSGPYLAIATLAFAEAFRSIVIALPHITRGDEGMPLRALILGAMPNYYASLVLMLILTIVIHLIANYYFRLPFIAVRENEVAARASGIDVTKYRLLSFALSAFFTGIAGSFYAFYRMAITPEELSIDTSFMPLTIAVVGGMGTVTGPVLGAYILVLLTESLRALIYRIRILIYAVLTVAFIMLMPGGTLGALRSLTKRVPLPQAKASESRLTALVGQNKSATSKAHVLASFVACSACLLLLSDLWHI
jgi:branched-chain amino acid transport system permease protein